MGAIPFRPMSDAPDIPDDFDPEMFFEKFGEAELQRGDSQVDLDRLREQIIHAVASHPDRDTLVELMGHPSSFYAYPASRADEFELRLVSLESGQEVTLGTLPLADILAKPQG
jgi:hypothetical protein